MRPPAPDSPENSLSATASRWTVRRDRGLSAAESIEYELWLAADPRHAAAMQRSSAAWSRLDRIPDHVALQTLAATTRRRSFWRRTVAVTALAAAALIVGVFVTRRPAALPVLAAAFSAPVSPRTVALSDGSLVQLNTGGAVVEQFTAAERRVVLTRGEAHFSVTKNPARPFIVSAGALQVRAVGTAFNINLQAAIVAVIVTEGRIAVTASPDIVGPDRHAPFSELVAGERAILPTPLVPADQPATTLVVSRVAPAELAHALAWREPLMRLGGSTLAELAVEFERSTGKHLVFADPALGELRFGGRFRADDIDGFTHLLATTLDLDVESAADGTIVLRKKK
jgi:transmembrane sensor